MRVVVTGGAGRLGQLTIGELLDHGHDVLSIDKVPISESVCRSSVIDLLQADDLAAQADHPAAIAAFRTLNSPMSGIS